MYLEALGTKVLVLSSVKVIEDLLEGRSSIYSDRPHLPMLHGQYVLSSHLSTTSLLTPAHQPPTSE